jgi:DNA-binding MarR family transcriptional regulator
VRRTPNTSRTPLARLFAIAYRQLVDNLHDRLRTAGWHDVRPAFGFVLVAARDRPTSVVELALLMGVTKQAASKLVELMAGCGYVERGISADDRRQRLVSLTSRGRALLESVEQIYAELEAEWATVLGATHVERMRRDLLTLLATDDGRLPAVRPPTGSA